MQSFNDCISMHPAPFLVKEVPDFKGYVDGYICDGKERLVGHSKPLQFRFYMQDGTPLMQYKLHPKSTEWLPQDGIQIWKQDEDGKPRLPQGQPKLLPPFEFIKDHEQVIHGLSKYVEYWKAWVDQRGDKSSYANWITPVIQYWEIFIPLLKKPNIQVVSQCKYFWPKTCIMVDSMNHVQDDDELLGLHELDGHYCGPSSKKPLDEYKPDIDVKMNDFILIRPCENIYPIWLGVAISDVDIDKSLDKYMKVKIQYWAPFSNQKQATIAEVYKNCWTKYWMCNKKDPERWEHVNSIVWSWTPKIHSQKIKIPKIVCMKAQESLKCSRDDDISLI